jgi:hypothetical protein
MVDSGCNTLLLPMDDTTLDVLIQHYSGVGFHWRIRQTGGVGALSSPVMVISGVSAPHAMMTFVFRGIQVISKVGSFEVSRLY